MFAMNTAMILKALSNQKRLDLLEWLKSPELHFPKEKCAGLDKQEVCVGLIEQKLGLSQSTASKYLAQLQHAGLVSARREGQWTYYRYNRDTAQAFMQALQQKI